MVLASILAGLVSLLCAAWTLLSDLGVVAGSPTIRELGLIGVFVSLFLLLQPLRKAKHGAVARRPTWRSKAGRLYFMLAMTTPVLVTGRLLALNHVNLDAASHVAGVVTATLVFTWAAVRGWQSRPAA